MSLPPHTIVGPYQLVRKLVEGGSGENSPPVRWPRSCHNFGFGVSPVWVATGDFNMDQKLKLVTAHYDSSRVGGLINQSQ